MKTIKYLLLTLILTLAAGLPLSWADQKTEVNEAKTATLKALQSYPQVQKLEKSLLHKTTKNASDVLPIDQKQLQIAGAVALTAATGKVSSKPLNIKRNISGVSISPLVEYDFKKKSAGSLNLQYSF